MIQISGRSESECSGSVVVTNDQLTSGQFQMPLDKLDTGIALRNKHLRENYLHTDQFPLAKLKVTSIEALAEHLNNKAVGRNKFEGFLELKGKEAPVMDATYEKKGSKVSAKFSLDLPNHGIDRPAFMGIKIVDKVTVIVQFDIL